MSFSQHTTSTFPYQAQACPPFTALNTNTPFQNYPTPASNQSDYSSGKQKRSSLNGLGRTILDNWLDQYCRNINNFQSRHAKQAVIRQVQEAGNKWFHSGNLKYYINQKHKKLCAKSTHTASQSTAAASGPSSSTTASEEEELLFGQIPITTRTTLCWLFQANTGEASLSYWADKYSISVQDVQSYFAYLSAVGTDMFHDIPLSAKLKLQSLLETRPNADHQMFRIWAERTGVKVTDVTAYIIHLRKASIGGQHCARLPTSPKPDPSASAHSQSRQKASPDVSISSAGDNVTVTKQIFQHPLAPSALDDSGTDDTIKTTQNGRDSSAKRAEHQTGHSLTHPLAHAHKHRALLLSPDSSAAARTTATHESASEPEPAVGVDIGTTTQVLKQGRRVSGKNVVGSVSHAGVTEIVTHDNAGADVAHIRTRTNEDSVVQSLGSEATVGHSSPMAILGRAVGRVIDVVESEESVMDVNEPHGERQGHLMINSSSEAACWTSDHAEDDKESIGLSDMEIDELADDDEDQHTGAEMAQNATVDTASKVPTSLPELLGWIERNEEPLDVLLEFGSRLKLHLHSVRCSREPGL